MATSWASIENAIVAAVKAASGLADGRVILVDQNGPRPGQSVPAESPFATVMLSIPREVAPPEVTTNYDGTTARAPGAEIQYVASTTYALDVSVQFFGAATTGDSSALAMAATFRSSLALPPIRFGLRDAGLSIFERGAIRNLSALLETGYESRALVEISAYLRDDVTSYTGYIDEVVVDGMGIEVIAGPDDVEVGPLPPALGPAASVVLGPAAGVGASIVVHFAYDGGGSVTITPGTGAGAGILFTVHFSRNIVEYAGSVNNEDANAAAMDLDEQCYVSATGGTTMPVEFNAEGPTLAEGVPVSLTYSVVGAV